MCHPKARLEEEAVQGEQGRVSARPLSCGLFSQPIQCAGKGPMIIQTDNRFPRARALTPWAAEDCGPNQAERNRLEREA